MEYLFQLILIKIKLKGFDDDGGILYHTKLKDLFSICGKNLIMHYEYQKAYIEFNHNFNNIHTKISFEVYLSVMLSRLMNRMNGSLLIDRVLNNQNNRIILEKINREKNVRGVDNISKRNLEDQMNNPDTLLGNASEFMINVTEINGFGNFWAHVAEPRFEERLRRIQNELQMQTTKLVQIKQSDIYVGKIVITLFYDSDTEEYKCYRARIERITSSKSLRVHYIDYGNYEDNKDIQLLFELPESLKTFLHQAFMCNLAKVRLTHIVADNFLRSEKATNEFKNILNNCIGNLRASVYSIVDGLVNVDLFDVSSDLVEIDIAALLIKLGFCERCQESPRSIVRNYFIKKYNIKLDTMVEIATQLKCIKFILSGVK